MSTYTIKYGDTLSAIAKSQGTTVDALMKENPSITDPNRITAGTSLKVSGSTNAAPTPQPTNLSIEEKANLVPDLPEEDEFTTDYYEQKKNDALTPEEERKIRREIRQRLNSEIRSLRLTARQKIAEEQRTGEGRLGSARAIQARSGTLGSNFAGAENDQINDLTKQNVDLTNAEVNAKIAALSGLADQDAIDQIAAQKEAATKSAEEYMTYLNERDSIKTTKATALAKAFATQGIDPTQLSETDIQKLSQTYGLDLATFSAMVTEAKNEINKDEFFNLTEGQARYRINPETGETELVAENVKNFAPKAGTGTGGGTGADTTAFGSDLDALVGMVAPRLALNQRNDFYNQLRRARNDEDKLAIISSAVNIPGDARSDLINTKAGQNSLKQAISMINNGVKTGIFKAGADYAFNLFGGQVDPAMTQLKQLIVAAVQPYRSSITGAAWGAQEEAEYRSLFGSAKDTPTTLLTKLNNLDRIMTNKRVSIVSSNVDPLGVNSSYDSYYATSPYAETPETNANEIEVRSPDGRIIMIPADSLDQALQAGYTQT